MLTKVTTITPVEVWMRLKDADLLKGQMRVQGHTTRSLAEAVECSRGFIGDLCRGAKNQCSPNLAHKIAAELETEVRLLFFVESSKNPGQNAKAKLAEKKNRTARRSAA
jgi:plasmid maintenance system antidote protein VapI